MVLALLSTAAYGQAVFGNIVGTATDPQGAAVANAKVTVTSQAKATSVTTTTNESGNFSVTHLIPDVYKVKFEGAGFKSFEQGDVPVSADGTYRVDCQFQVGSTTETLEITGEPPQLQTDKSDIAIQFNNTYVQDLPTLNRNFTQFELMSPGTQKLTGWSHANTENPQAGQQIFVNGQHFSGTNFELDGTDNQDPILGIIVINPNLDGVTEAKIALQQYDAEMGKAVAGYVTAQTKSGSNEFHGSAFWFRRTDANQARDPFSQFQLVDGRYIPSTRWQEYGGSIGGPIIKNKLFFFGDYQGQKYSTGVTNTYSIPTAKVESTCSQTTGFCDLSEYLGAGTGGSGGAVNGTTYQQGQVFDPNTGSQLNGTGRTAFAGNLIPNSLISPQARAILAFFPAPNTAGINNGTQNNYLAGGAGPFDQNAFDVRTDWVATSTLNVFGRYSLSYFSVSGAPGLGKAGGTGFGSGGLAGGSTIHNYSLSVGATKTFGQNWVSDFRFGWFKYNPQTHKYFAGLTPMSDIGVPGLNITNQGALTAAFTSGLPAFQMNSDNSTLTNFGEGLNVGRCNCPLVEDESQFQGVNNWTRLWGNHSIKFGADIRSANNLRVPSDANRTGVLNFDHLTTSTSGVGGLDLASFLFGDVATFNRFVSTTLNASEHQWRYFFYGQDTWRLTPKLTVNYGLRWEIYMPESVNAKGNGGFANPSLAPGAGNGVIRVGGYGPYDLSGNVSNNYHAFAPRFGLAYSMNEKTVIRMGFGMSYDIGVFGSNFGHAVTQNLPVLANQNLDATNVNPNASVNIIPAFNLAVGPVANVFPVIPATGVLPLGGPQGNVQPRMRPTSQVLPTVMAWNVAIQRQLTNNLTLDIAYVANAGRHGFNGDGPSYNVNPVNIQNWALTYPCQANPSAVQCQPGGPGLASLVSQSQRQFYNGRFITPYTDANGVTTAVVCCNGGIMGNYFGNDANSSYNALQVKLQQNMAHGLQFIAHYTWSHALNHNCGYFAINPAVCYGPDDQNRPQVFVANVVYQLPFGKGKQFLNNVSTWENQIVGGWQVTSTLNYSAGLPFTPSYGECGSDNDVGICFPMKGNGAQWSMGGNGYNNQTHTVVYFTPIAPMTLANTPNDPSVGTNCLHFYGAWGRPCAGTLGDAGVYSLSGPRSFTSDMSVMKNFPLTERFQLQFRMDAFNIFNHPVLGFNGNQGGTCIDCSGNGLVTSLDANVSMRQLQFALRLQF
jgi:hypothetical protein